MKKTFRTCDNKGFQITFPNGVTLSTQFGWANYCEHYDDPMPDFKLRAPDIESNDAEIAIFGPNGKWLTREFKDRDDDVIGRVRIAEWLMAFKFCLEWEEPPNRGEE